MPVNRVPLSSAQDGLDVTRADDITPEEVEAYRATYLGTNKGLLDSFEFWLEFRPDVLKRHKARTAHFEQAEPKWPLVGVLGAMHQYAVRGFRDGVLYELRLARTLGATSAELLDVLSVAFIHSGHPGMYAAAAAKEELRAYEESSAQPNRFPAEWVCDPTIISSGMDFSERDARARDIDSLRDWYLSTLGEVPSYVESLARRRPGLLKAYRDRYEHAIRALPIEMLPIMLLNHNVVRGAAEGVRENVLLGRAMGIAVERLEDAIAFGVLHSGIETLGVAERAAGDILDGMGRASSL